MKKILLLIIASGTLCGFDLQDGTKTIVLNRPGQSYDLEVVNGQGAVTVEAYNGQGIVLTAENPDRDFEIKESDNHVSIRCRDKEHLNPIQLKIPAGSTSLKLTTHNKGDITVTGVSAALEVNHLNGSIHLQQVSGTVVAATLNGRIEASFRKTDTHTAMAFSNLNGDIDLLFPADYRANLRLKAPKGDINFRYFGPSGYRLNKAAGDDWALGQIGSGGPELMVSCGHGNIIIRKH
jgi:hypothetical protein